MAPKWNLALLCISAFAICTVTSENILVWEVIGTHSSRISIWPLIEALSEKGHNITFLSAFESMDKSDTKIKTVLPKKWIEAVGDSWENHFSFFELRKSPWNTPKLWLDVQDTSIWACQCLYDDPEFVSWITAKETKFDLVIVESIGNDCAYGLIPRWNAKLIIYGTTTVLPFMPDAFGIPDETASVSDMTLGFPSNHKKPLSFWQRLVNAFYPIIFNAKREWYTLPKLEEITRKGLGTNEIPKFRDVEKNASLIFLTTHYSYGASMSLPPNVISVGGSVVSKKAKPLPEDMQKFIDSGKEGFIYISFGTMVEFVKFDEEIQIQFIKALEKFPEMRFVWKSALPINKPLPKNVLVAKWAPQQTLLSHPKIKAFISHGGMGSTTEAIHFGVPIICIPIVADQDMNAEVIVEREAGVKLEILTLKSEELQGAIDEILHNDKYRKGIARLSKIFKDRPRSPLEEAMWYVEFVLRNDNIHEILMQPSAHLPWWKRRQIDVWAFATLCLVASVGLAFCFVIFVTKMMVKIFTTKASGTKKVKTK